MRNLSNHEATENQTLIVAAVDKPGAGGANHEYEIFIAGKHLQPDTSLIVFQNGPIKEVGVNGITQEVLLAIIEDRLTSFQNGPFSSEDNAEALVHVKAALKCLHKRTLDRIARGVEGLTKK